MNPLDVYDILLNHFGKQGWWPMQNSFHPKEWEIEVGAILTQNTNWTNVEKALRNLKQEGIVSREKTISASEKGLASLIRPSGYYNQKAKKLKALAKFSEVAARESLLNIWGIGKETADSILLYAHGVPIFVVDAYTKRIFSRLGLIEADWDYDRVRKFFESNVPKRANLYKEYHALIVMLGKSFCKTKSLCIDCPLKKKCSYVSISQ